MDEVLFNASLHVVRCIQEDRYEVLQKQKCLEKISKEYIKNVMTEYGGVLSTVNGEDYIKYFQYIQKKNQDKYMTYLDLIIDGERSDLTLVCEIELINNGTIKVLVDDLHVL